MADKDGSKVVSLFDGADPRCGTLLYAIIDVINDRAVGMPVPYVLGVLRLVEHSVISGKVV